MKINKHYFSEARNEASEKFFNGDGFEDQLYADGFPDEQYAAEGAAEQVAAQPSLPYIIQIANGTTAAITDVEILNPSLQIANGATPKTGVTVTYGISGYTYAEFLYQILTKPFEVGFFVIESATATQLSKTWTLKKKDGNGNLTQRVLTPKKDVYQQDTTQIIVRHAFTVDSHTALILSTLVASVTDLTIYLYPAQRLDTAKALVKAPAISEYRNPQLVQGQKLVVGR